MKKSLQNLVNITLLAGGLADCFVHLSKIPLPYEIQTHTGNFAAVAGPTICLELLRIREVSKIPSYLPKILTVASTVYWTLGETILNIIPGNVMDTKDVPGVLTAGLLAYFFSINKK